MKGSSIGILTDRSLVKMRQGMTQVKLMWPLIVQSCLKNQIIRATKRSTIFFFTIRYQAIVSYTNIVLL